MLSHPLRDMTGDSPGEASLLGHIFFYGSHLVCVVDVTAQSGNCYVMVEDQASGERWPMTRSLARDLLSHTVEFSKRFVEQLQK